MENNMFGMKELTKFMAMVEKEIDQIETYGKNMVITSPKNKSMLSAIESCLLFLKDEMKRSKRDIMNESDMVQGALIALLQELRSQVTQESFNEIVTGAGLRISPKPWIDEGH